jgi:hypothetical protein
MLKHKDVLGTIFKSINVQIFYIESSKSLFLQCFICILDMISARNKAMDAMVNDFLSISMASYMNFVSIV